MRHPLPFLAAVLGLVAAACGGAGNAAPDDGRDPAGRAAQNEAFVVAEPAPLSWLAANQRPDGSWSADDAPAGSPADDVSATALAVLAFLDHAWTNRSEGPFGRVVAGGLRWLKGVQEEDGRFRPRDRAGSLRHDALATMALVEVYGLTGSPLYRAAAQRAIAGLVASGAATPPPDGESGPFTLDAFGWALDALGTARRIGAFEVEKGNGVTFEVSEAVLAPARAWLDGTRAATADDPSMVATRILVRAAIGRGRADLDALRSDVLRLAAHPVATNVEDDLPARVAASAQAGSCLAGARTLEAWFPRARAWLAAAAHDQEDEGVRRGAYDERGPLGARTGRVEATALGAMVEPPMCTAYLPRFPGTEPEPSPAGEPEGR